MAWKPQSWAAATPATAMFLLPYPSFHLLASYDMATVLCLLLMLELGPESLPVKFGILTVSSLILG